MGRTRTWLNLLACWALLCCLAPAARAGESPQHARQELRQRLEQLSQRHDLLERTLAETRREITELEAKLARAETELAGLAQKERLTARQLARTRAQARELARLIHEQEKRYRARLRALYLFGPEASLTLLAGSRDFQDAITRSRALTLILQADHRHLQELKRQRRRAADLQARLVLRQGELADIRRRLQESERRLAKLKQERQALLPELEQKRRRLEENMALLREAEARLARTFALGRPPAAPRPGSPPPGVLAARGWLSPPVEGRVLGHSGPGRRGVEMAARPGAPVRAPWSGVVVYAGVLSGYGRVLVLDHGQRVHTVLAQLGALAVEKGDHLRAGQLVGSVGPSGTLYLEVRRGARPVNPLLWLRLTP